MNIDIRIHIPGGINSARSNRSAVRAAVVNALAAVVQQEIETRAGRIVNPDDEQIGDLTCTIAGRHVHGVLHPTNSERIDSSHAFSRPTANRLTIR